MHGRWATFLLFSVCLAGCGHEAEPSFDDPAACVAAFDYAYTASKETALENDPSRAEIKTRILFELEKLQKGEGLAEGQKRAEIIARQLKDTPSRAIELAGHCAAAQAMTDNYEKERPRLQGIADKKE